MVNYVINVEEVDSDQEQFNVFDMIQQGIYNG